MIACVVNGSVAKGFSKPAENLEFKINLHHFLRNVLESFENSLLRRACIVFYSISVAVLFDEFAITNFDDVAVELQC